jgi:hypothetical protein
MMIRKTITGIFTVALLTVVMAVSAGFTVIVHSCNTCGIYSFHSEFFSDTKSDFDNCCCNSDSHDECDHTGDCGKGCCDTKIEDLKVSNYLPVGQIKVVYYPELKAELQPHDIIHEINPISLSCENGYQKYGGRQIIASCCCLII